MIDPGAFQTRFKTRNKGEAGGLGLRELPADRGARGGWAELAVAIGAVEYVRKLLRVKSQEEDKCATDCR